MARARKQQRQAGLPRWGATEAQAKRFQEMRTLKNRIFELEEQLKKGTPGASQDDRWMPTTNEICALGKVCHISVDDAARLGILSPVMLLAELHKRLVAWSRVHPDVADHANRPDRFATGKEET